MQEIKSLVLHPCQDLEQFLPKHSQDAKSLSAQPPSNA